MNRPPIVDPEILDELDLYEEVLYFTEELDSSGLETVYRLVGLLRKNKLRPELAEEIKRDFSEGVLRG